MTDTPTRGLTIKQPWAFAIAEGFKTTENRTRRTNYRGTLLIHAGRGVDDSVSIVRHSRDAAIRLDELGGRSNFWDARTYLPSSIAPPPPTSLALCAVIATARLADCHEAADGCCPPWGLPGQWHWELADIRPLDRAVAKSGALGFWKPDAVLLDAMRPACRKCRTPFDPADHRFDGRAQYRDTPYCRSCTDFCQDTEIADHRCVICA
ncbi:hypothetical protein DCW30_05695 [Streptomyces alfalfae]|uniref:ASCH domain-containing protein n=1 Tax=Streptomyces alfalfae TaxID=1642299 RepID=A0ABM6GWN4_9ACTN|nr:hypothetical protein [Streptomyces alfalfae]APY88206.1 hypothetical protein A7J05_23180 [Streptomyces alfalfae]AYA18601.1 hypothetical protein D3X13_22290 [Streptomyces fradiae]RXX46519.1 hypothetical protein DCW30_05695 [Streptomyces alfalfae]RZM90032.1 hypothetical protein D4104_25630 [Streptomyces alfalfae]